MTITLIVRFRTIVMVIMAAMSLHWVMACRNVNNEEVAWWYIGSAKQDSKSAASFYYIDSTLNEPQFFEARIEGCDNTAFDNTLATLQVDLVKKHYLDTKDERYQKPIYPHQIYYNDNGIHWIKENPKDPDSPFKEVKRSYGLNSGDFGVVIPVFPNELIKWHSLQETKKLGDGAHARGVVAWNVKRGMWMQSSCPAFLVDLHDAIPASCETNAQHYHCAAFNSFDKPPKWQQPRARVSRDLLEDTKNEVLKWTPEADAADNYNHIIEGKQSSDIFYGTFRPPALDCSICTVMFEPMQTKCHHLFCRKCIVRATTRGRDRAHYVMISALHYNY